MAHGAGITPYGGHPGAAAGEHEVGHPGERIYIRVALILAVITVIEVAIYYIQWVHDAGILVPALLALSALKFSAVVGYFMHLKFDDRRLLWIFLSGLVVAFAIIISLKVLHNTHPIDYAVRLFTGGA
ncbi:MAG: cytochrome C oxidase subunit IV [Chloroflexota bacterium]